MRIALQQILNDNDLFQQDLYKAMQKLFEFPIKPNRLSKICNGKAEDMNISSLIQIIEGLQSLGVYVTPNDIILNEQSDTFEW